MVLSLACWKASPPLASDASSVPLSEQTESSVPLQGLSTALGRGSRLSFFSQLHRYPHHPQCFSQLNPHSQFHFGISFLCSLFFVVVVPQPAMASMPPALGAES